ncbi:hypothetical protein SESBI_04042 [Sesbania bispinosa]|nr:hypothetical protein SESBI_04042 [Sesbania bispinosa]
MGAATAAGGRGYDRMRACNGGGGRTHTQWRQRGGGAVERDGNCLERRTEELLQGRGRGGLSSSSLSLFFLLLRVRPT